MRHLGYERAALFEFRHDARTINRYIKHYVKGQKTAIRQCGKKWAIQLSATTWASDPDVTDLRAVHQAHKLGGL